MSEVLPSAETAEIPRLANVAVVIGGSIAGTFAAAALAEHVDHVIVLDSAPIEDASDPNAPVPPSHRHRRQMHNLLRAGQLAAEEVIPGYLDELRSLGAGFADVAQDIHVNAATVEMPSGEEVEKLRFSWISARRSTYELAARRAITAENIEWRDQTTATGLVVDNNEVTGVKIWNPETKTEEILEASIVVDATGLKANPERIEALKWLEEAGGEWAVPHVDIEESGMMQQFRGMIVKRPLDPDQEGDDPPVDSKYQNDELHMVLPSAWTDDRGIVVAPVEKDKWYISANRRGAGPMPTTFYGLLQHAVEVAGTDHPIVDMLLSVPDVEGPEAEPGEEVKAIEAAIFAIQSIWTVRYDMIVLPVTGFVAIGDSVGTRNALDGRGMSAAMQMAASIKATAAAAKGNRAAFTRNTHERVVDISNDTRKGVGGLVGLDRDTAHVFARAAADVPGVFESTMRSAHMLSEDHVEPDEQ